MEIQLFLCHRKIVGAQGHTPSRWANMKTIAANKTSSFNERVRRREGENEMMAANIIPSLMGMFAAVKGVCDTPLHIYDRFDDNTMIESVDL